jgi:hypothetical protein
MQHLAAAPVLRARYSSCPFFLVCALLVLFTARSARAEREMLERFPRSSAEERRSNSVKPEPQYRLGEKRWYGWQTLLADGVGIGIMLASLDDGDRFAAGAVTYLTVAPIVHAAHARAGASFASLGLHALGETVGLFVWLVGCGDSYDEETGREQYSCEGGVAPGVSLLVMTSLLDASFLGWERERIPIATVKARPSPSPRASFAIRPHAGGLLVSLSGHM